MANNRAQIIIDAQNNASGALRSVGDDLGALSSKASQTSSGFGSLVGAFALGNIAANAASAAFSALTGFVRGSFDAAMEAESGQAKLEAILRSTGGAAGITASELNTMAGEMARLTTFTDDQYTASQAVMLQFTNVGRDIFPTAQRAAADLATAMGVDLASASRTVGLALQSPEKASKALMQANIRLTDAENDMLEKLVDTGKEAEAQRFILEKLAATTGGQAAAAAETYQGKMTRLQNTIGEVQENIGKALLPSLDLFIGSALEAGDSAQSATADTEQWARTIYTLASGLKAAAYVTLGTIKYIVGFGVQMVETGKVVYAVGSDIVQTFKQIAAAGQTVFQALAKAISGDFVGALDTLKKGFTFDFSRSKAALNDMSATVSKITNSAAQDFLKAGDAWREGWDQKGFKPVKEAANLAASDIKGATDKISAASKGAASKFSEAVDTLKEKLADLKTKLLDTVDEYQQKSADLLSAHKEKLASINADIASLEAEHQRNTIASDKAFQESQLSLYMQHQDRLVQIQADLKEATKDLQGEDNEERKAALRERIASLGSKLEEEKAVVSRYDSLKAAADDYRKTTDLDRLKAKHEAEKAEATREFEEKMSKLRSDLAAETAEYEKHNAELLDATQKKYRDLNVEVDKGWKDMLKTAKGHADAMRVIEDQVMAIKAAIERARASIGGGGVSAAPLSGARASGGPVSAGRSYLVGEKGPEVFTPSSSGTIIPNGSGGAQTVTVKILEGAVLNVTNEGDEDRLVRKAVDAVTQALQANRYGLASAH